jgi:hypothetical protein
MFLHLILASKFSMPPTTHAMKGNYATYEHVNEVADIILGALEDLRLLD